MAESLRLQTLKGVKWGAVEKFSMQAVQFVVTLVMARLLTPDDYGTVGLVAIFIAVAQSLIESGFAQALVRKQDRTDSDCSTVFFFNLVVSVVLYFMCFIAAPFVAAFYNIPILTNVMRVICLVLVINGLALVQRALFTANVDFRAQAKATILAGLISGVCGVISALYGFGVWALVVQQITNAIVNTIALWTISSWRPKFVYSWNSFREMFGFGSKFMISGIINTVYNNISGMIIGKVYTASTLGFYSRAQHFVTLPTNTLSGIVSSVSYPVLCKIQDDNERLSEIYRKLIKQSAFMVFVPVLIMSAIAEPMVVFLIGEKWRFAGQLLLIMGFSQMWYPVHLLNLNLLAVKGRSDLFLRLEIIKKVLGFSVIVISIPYGIVIFVYAGIASSIISLMINTYYTGKLIGVGFFRQMQDLMPILLLSLSSYVIVRILCYCVQNLYVQLFGGVIIGISFAFVVSYLLNFQELQELISIIKTKTSKK